MVAGPLGPHGYEPMYGIEAGLPGRIEHWMSSDFSNFLQNCTEMPEMHLSTGGGPDLRCHAWFSGPPLKLELSFAMCIYYGFIHIRTSKT